MINFIISLIPILTSLVISIILYKRLEPLWLRSFTWFMLFTVILSVAGYVYSFYFKKSNHFIFNIYLPFQFLFYFGIFYKTFQSKKLKLIIILVSIGFSIYTFSDFFDIIHFYTFNSLANTLGSILIIFFCLIYFVSLFKSEGIINYFKIPMFWIATGLLFFFVGNIIYLSFIDYIIMFNLDKSGSVYWFIMTTLDLLLYSFFSIGFLSNQAWRKKI